jgi:hypothetical protein
MSEEESESLWESILKGCERSRILIRMLHKYGHPGSGNPVYMERDGMDIHTPQSGVVCVENER